MEHTNRMLNPTPGQWAVLRGPGTFAKAEISIGAVRRREGFKLRFHNQPFGHPINRIENVIAVRQTEEGAQHVADRLREAQRTYAVEAAEAKERFWATANAAGVMEPRNGIIDRGEYETRRSRRDDAAPPSHARSEARAASPFAVLGALVNQGVDGPGRQ